MKGGRGLMKASAPGTAIAGVAHLSSNAARKTFLTIATDKQIHTLTNQSSKTLGVKISNKGHDDVGRALEIAGNAALGVVGVDPQPVGAPAIAADPAPPPVSQPAAVPTLADRLRELADLHKEGILSDQEFADAKAKLLGGLLSRARETSHVYLVADDTDQAVDDLTSEWSSERRQRGVIDTDTPADADARRRPDLARRVDNAIRQARLRAERDAVQAVAPGAVGRLAALDLRLRLERVAPSPAGRDEVLSRT